jgi:hypothetical protein
MFNIVIKKSVGKPLTFDRKSTSTGTILIIGICRNELLAFHTSAYFVVPEIFLAKHPQIFSLIWQCNSLRSDNYTVGA